MSDAMEAPAAVEAVEEKTLAVLSTSALADEEPPARFSKARNAAAARVRRRSPAPLAARRPGGTTLSSEVRAGSDRRDMPKSHCAPALRSTPLTRAPRAFLARNRL